MFFFLVHSRFLQSIKKALHTCTLAREQKKRERTIIVHVSSPFMSLVFITRSYYEILAANLSAALFFGASWVKCMCLVVNNQQ